MTGGRTGGIVFGLTCLVWLGGERPVSADPPLDQAAVEFFEKQVRPILVERCIDCHGPDKQKGELRLDSRAALLEGGMTGPAVEPGEVDSSLLIDAVRYGELQMPPKSKLPAEEIEILTRWVEGGAAWGVESTEPTTVGFRGEFEDSPEFARRAEFWSFQPLLKVHPPEVKGQASRWPRNPIDAFLLTEMDERGLSPAPEADRRTLIRRVTFDLTGLPPTMAEVAAFVADESPEAYERLVDRLLASPQYGERSGRHWLDLVRFAETGGHEFDYDILNADRYRDYVVRAFNQDLPYDEFVVEQVAGDLLPTPRRHLLDGSNESILGTGFYWLGEGVHSPLDLRDEGMRRIDNQIDVLSKTFLGLTVSCARCHDHKFDPIGAKDYYALAGFLRSTRHQQAFVDSDVRIRPFVEDLKSCKADLAKLLLEAAPKLSEASQNAIAGLLDSQTDSEDSTFVELTPVGLKGWRFDGDAFEVDPESPYRIDLQTPSTTLVRSTASIESGLISDRLQGVARSPTFTIQTRWLHLLVEGTGGRVNIVIDGFEKIRDPIYGGLTFRVPATDEPQWVTRDLETWIGRRAYLEVCDGAAVDFTGATARMVDGHGRLSLLAATESTDPTPPATKPSRSASINVADLLKELKPIDSSLASRINSILRDYREIESRIPEPTLAPATVDGDGEDEYLMIRGNTRSLGPAVPRRALAVLGGAAPEPETTGSGRLGLAHAMIDVGSNPLLPRVMVNRLWKQHFGEGLVRSTDDFGVMGQTPSHPALLDWLAAEFVDRGWSLKAMHRLMLLSSAYRMQSRAEPEADRLDPTNTLLHRANVRRLEAEAVRDSLLAVSGRLDSKLGGASVPPYLSPFMEGRGRPAESGPLDGDRRRSLYLQVRRNFLNPMFLVFDAPVPFSTMGRRHASNVPAQALTLLNDPLVLDLAVAWADRILTDPTVESAGRDRIQRLYQEAFGRPATDEETSRCLDYLAERSEEEPRGVWTDLCHALFNVKEFVYID